jgi:putative nucleotidyltransferase-like protein
VGTDAARLAVAVANLRIDSFTAEVVAELRAAGVRAVLLKGPGVARWLYDGAGERAYVDADLLVAPRDLRRAERALGRMGFQPGEWLAWLRRARPWTRSDGTVDLHTSLFGISVPPCLAWEVLSRSTETMAVGGIEMQVLALPARALHTAIHVAQHPPSHRHGQARADLERAIAQASWPTWRAAARLAAELGAEPALAGGLRRVERGAALAEALGLHQANSAETALFAEDASSVPLKLAEIAAADSIRLRLTLILRAIVPPRTLVRTQSPRASRSEVGLALAYFTRLAEMAWRTPAGLVSWLRARG